MALAPSMGVGPSWQVAPARSRGTRHLGARRPQAGGWASATARIAVQIAPTSSSVQMYGGMA